MKQWAAGSKPCVRGAALDYADGPSLWVGSLAKSGPGAFVSWGQSDDSFKAKPALRIIHLSLFEPFADRHRAC